MKLVWACIYTLILFLLSHMFHEGFNVDLNVFDLIVL